MILAIFAHPDDEIGVGSTLAYYGLAREVPTTLVCATRGEKATIYCADCATAENLAEVRTRELACSCAHLGISDLRWLDWPDGGVAELARPEAVGSIVELIRELQPDVIISHPADGLYPHPDHVAIWEIVREAFDKAADSEAYPEFGRAWATARLFTRAIPRSFFAKVPKFADYRVELNGKLLPFYATPDEEISVRMHVKAWTERRMLAWECHRSQHNPDSPFSGLPDGLQREMAENELFVMAASRVALPDGVVDDLLAGLESEESHAEGDAAFVSELRGRLAVHRALAVVFNSFLHLSGERELLALWRQLEELEHEMIYLIAQALRSQGETVGEGALDGALISAARRPRHGDKRLLFVRRHLQQELASCQALAEDPSMADHQEFWQELATLVSGQLDGVL